MDHDDTPQRKWSNRPSRAPSGPRIPTKQKHPVDGPSSPSLDGAPTGPPSPITTSIDASLPPISPYADVAVQAPSTPPLQPQKLTPTTFVAPPPLTPPPTITFDSTPIPWKGLPLEAAQWTFSSAELQEIVSKAIRLSARESFVRLLSLQALEVDIVHESERLDSDRVAAQAKWRFELGRRTMLMQALNSSAASSVPNASTNPPGAQVSGNTIMSLVGQLAASVASCDALLASVLHLSDQQSQIAVVQHQHWASALGIALSKLNRAHERQANELQRAQARIQTLEDELEEAWREAEKMAIEFDDLEHEVAACSTEGSSEGADAPSGEEVGQNTGVGPEGMDIPPEQDVDPDTGGDVETYAVDSRTGLDIRRDLDETGTLGDATINTEVAVVLGVTATAVASKATLVTSPVNAEASDKADTKSVRSLKSTRSRRSTRDGPSHFSRLAAARLRSRTASNASLRLPKALRSSTHPPVDPPPIPTFPQDCSFLDMSNGAQQARKPVPPQRHPEPTLALPTPPHSAGLSPTRVPSIWLETDGGKSTRLNGLDRAHSLQIFSSLMTRTPCKTRRSNLVMSLTGPDSPVDAPCTSTGLGLNIDASTSANAGPGVTVGAGGHATASPTSNTSPVSLPTHALAHFRGASSSSSNSAPPALRPGSAGARLTTTEVGVPAATPRRSLVSRASSVILRRLSQATTIGSKGVGKGSGGAGGKVGSLASPFSSPARSREALRLSEEGEVMLIGSPHADLLDEP